MDAEDARVRIAVEIEEEIPVAIDEEEIRNGPGARCRAFPGRPA
jgi:hypothetical protein